jgi:hypothetical protein
MSNIPFERQRLPVDLVGQIERDIALGSAVSGSDLLAAIEQSVGLQLAARFRDIVNKFSIPAVKRRGRPSSCKGREDFALEEVNDRYPALLRKFKLEGQQRRLLAAAEGSVLASAEPTPSELAYAEILKSMHADFPNLNWSALRNSHSRWNKGHFHPVENDIDSDDFDAEIDRRFPSVPES